MRGYRPQLDSLRAFAVAPVLAAHFWLFDLELSVLGVRLFFVLSGFLLTRILLEEKEAAQQIHLGRRALLRDFYARRILRIWPAYYFALAAAVLAGAAGLLETAGWHTLFASNVLFFLEQQWFPPVTAHLWTLAVEEQFYLLLPVAVLFLSATRLRQLLVAAIAAAIAFRFAICLTVRGTLDFYFVLPVAHLDALCGGGLLALFQHGGASIAWRRLLMLSLAPALFFYSGILPMRADLSLGQAIYLLPMIAIIAGANSGVGGLAGQILSARPIVALGRISYGVYLYHLFVAAGLDWCADAFGLAPLPAGPLRFFAFSAATIVVALASWALLERPALALRHRFRRTTRAETLIPAAPA